MWRAVFMQGLLSHLRTMEDPPAELSAGHLRALRRGVDEIKSRTGASAWFDVVRRSVCFGYWNRDGSVRLVDILVPFYRDRERSVPGAFDPVFDRFTVDDVVKQIRLARVSPAVKARWEREWKQRREHEAREASAKEAVESLRDGARHMEREYERHSMGRKYRPMVAVP